MYSASLASFPEVLNGKRQLNKEHIRKLSPRFNVSPERFFQHEHVLLKQENGEQY